MKKILTCAVAFTVMATMAIGQKTKQANPVVKPAPIQVAPKIVMKSLVDSFSYAAGLNIANNMKDQGIYPLNINLLMKAIDDVFKNNPKQLTTEIANKCLQDQMKIFSKAKTDVEKSRGVAFLQDNKKRKEITTLPDGLQYEIMKEGEANGVKPMAVDTVVVDYVGTLIDGTEFDNSMKRGQPATFPVGGVIKGWTEILQMMTKGAHWKVYIPSELGYGERGAGASIPPNSVLVFEITLQDIKPAVTIKQ